MKIAAIVSTKGGPGKTTVGANLGAFCADAGLRTLLIDLDNQPSLSSFYALSHEAPGGTYQLIANNETRADQLIPEKSANENEWQMGTAGISCLAISRQVHLPVRSSIRSNIHASYPAFSLRASGVFPFCLGAGCRHRKCQP
ncbi:ParA family protein [Pseudomonas proteolytica]|uniref:ParA family protein n=1 Tax=Pseudomonas proteolytica TaxID=219574 RepID=UPI003D168920